MHRRLLPLMSCLAVLALTSSGCLSEATEILCYVSTDLPAERPLRLEVYAAYGRRAPTDTPPLLEWTRTADAALPQSFAVHPESSEQRDATVTIVVLAPVEGLGIMRNVVRLPFVPGRTQVARIFLSANCLRLVPPVRCAAAGLPAADCVVRDLCEASGLSCGINGQCVPIDVRPESRSDASVQFDALPFVSCGSRGDPCCPGGVCHSGALCNVDLCVGCGRSGERCCNGVCDPGARCLASGTCGVCGAVGQPCCPGADPSCNPGAGCSAGQCVSCGPEGAVCGPAPDPCHDVQRCSEGRCAPADPGNEAAMCGPAPDGCHDVQRCRSGTCIAAPGNDGTVCGAAPDACHDARRCAAGSCVTAPGNDGTVCGAAPDACHDARRCAAGSCVAAPGNEGALCGAGGDACHDAQRCLAGSCVARTFGDGTVCGAAPGPCHDAPRCVSGSCAPAAAGNNGAVCAPARNVCWTSGVCSGGVCGAETPRPESTSWDGVYEHRCCGGVPVDILTDGANCGGCGQPCAAGLGCVQFYGGIGVCRCNLANAHCRVRGGGATCYNAGAGDRCNCQSNGDCVAGQRCEIVTGQNYCIYN